MTCFFGTFRWCRIVLGVRLSRDLHMAYSHTKLSTHCIALIYWNNFNIESKTRVERKISNCCSPPKKLSLGQIYINATQLRGIPPPERRNKPLCRSSYPPSPICVLWISINLCPFLLDILVLCLWGVSIRFRPLQSLRSQTFVDLRLCIVAHSNCFPHKASSVAFVKECHYLFAG